MKNRGDLLYSLKTLARPSPKLISSHLQAMILDNEALFILEHFPASYSFLIKMEVLQPNMVQTKLSYIPKVSFYICLGLENFLLVDLEWEE